LAARPPIPRGAGRPVFNPRVRTACFPVLALFPMPAVVPKKPLVGMDLWVRMDLWVVEPSGEKGYYAHRKTTIGGRVSRDFTRGYGPEEYLLKKAMKGKYTIRVKYFSSSAPRLSGSVTLQVDIFTNFGRPNATRRSITVRLRRSKEIINVGDISF